MLEYVSFTLQFMLLRVPHRSLTTTVRWCTAGDHHGLRFQKFAVYPSISHSIYLFIYCSIKDFDVAVTIR
jgi:hypothetical protein